VRLKRWLAFAAGLFAFGAAWAAPPNDNFANAYVFNDAQLSHPFYTISNSGPATSEADELTFIANGQAIGSTAIFTVWYRWTATTNGRVSLKLTGPTLTPPGSNFIVEVFEGANLRALTPQFDNYPAVAVTNPQGPPVIFVARAGRTYSIRMRGLQSQSADSTLTLTPLASAQPNDLFYDAPALTGSAPHVTGSLVNASMNTFEDYFLTNFLLQPQETRSIWWTWTAPQSGIATLNNSQSGSRVETAIYVGTHFRNLTRIAMTAAFNGRQTAFHAVAGRTYYIQAFDTLPVVPAAPGVVDFTLSLAPSAPPQTTIAGAVLPTGRTLLRQITQPSPLASAFATIINTGTVTAQNCRIEKGLGLDTNATIAPEMLFTFQTASATNALVGTPETPVSILPGAAQNFVFAYFLSPNGSVTSSFRQVMDVQFACDNTDPAANYKNVNTLSLAGDQYQFPSGVPYIDIVAVAATPQDPGIVNVPQDGNTAAFFTVAAVNLLATQTVRVSADTGGLHIPVAISLCETDASAGGICKTPRSGQVTSTATKNEVLTYTIFVEGLGQAVPFDPIQNRIRLQFDSGGAFFEGTSVAVRTN
jgi:hypothetical protein